MGSGGQVRFEVAYGNIGAIGFANAQLRASIPTGSTLVSATDGGTQSGNEVVWDLNVTGIPDTLAPANVNEIIRVAESAEPKLTSLVMGVLAGERKAQS